MAVPKNTVTFENGETRNDVPPGIDTWESYQRYKAAQSSYGITPDKDDPAPKETEEYGAFGRDVKRAYHSLVGQPADFLEAHITLNAFVNVF